MHDVPGPAGAPDETVDPAGMSVLNVDGAEFGLGRRVAQEFIEGGQRYWTTARRSAKAKKQLRHWKTKRWIKSRLNFDFPDADKKARARTNVGVENVDVDVPNIDIPDVDIDAIDVPFDEEPETNYDIDLNLPAAVRFGYIQDTKDKKLLEYIALNDRSRAVVRAALQKIYDLDPLDAVRLTLENPEKLGNRAIEVFSDKYKAEIVKNSNDNDLIFAVFEEINDEDVLKDIVKVLSDSVADSDESELRSFPKGTIAFIAASRIKDEEFLRDIFYHSKLTGAREGAIKSLGELNDAGDLQDPSILQSEIGNKNAFIRIRAARATTDQDILAVLALEDENSQVREAAVERLQDENILAKIATTDSDDTVRLMAINAIDNEELLKEIVNKLSDFEKSPDSSFDDSDDWDLRYAAISKINDEQFLANYIISLEAGTDLVSVGKLAVSKINNQELLEKVFNEMADIPSIQSDITNKLHYRESMGEKVLELMLQQTNSPTMVKDALNHPSPLIRATALFRRSALPDYLFSDDLYAIAAVDPDPRIRRLSEALQRPSRDAEKRGRFVISPEQMVAGTKILLPDERSLPRPARAIAQPEVVAGLIDAFFKPELDNLPIFTLSEERNVRIGALAKALVAERISDDLQDISFNDMARFVDAVHRLKPDAVEMNIGLYQANEKINNIISGLVNERLSSETLIVDPENNYDLFDDLIHNGDGKTLLVMDRSDGKLYMIQYENEDQIPIPGPGTTTAALAGTPEAESLLRDHITSQMVRWWADTSNDRHAGSLAVQEAAKELALPDGTLVAEWVMEPELAQQVDNLTAYHGEVLQRFLQAQYRHTQSLLAALGIENLTMYRGANEVGTGDDGPATSLFLRRSSEGTLEPLDSAFIGERGELLLRPLSAWATNPEIAQRFTYLGKTSDAGGFLFAAQFPASLAFSTPLTGAGAFNEDEIVMIGNNLPVIVLGKNDERRLSSPENTQKILEDLLAEGPAAQVVNLDNDDRNADWIVQLLHNDEILDGVIEKFESEIKSSNDIALNIGPVDSYSLSMMVEMLEQDRRAGRTGLVDQIAALPESMRNQFLKGVRYSFEMQGAISSEDTARTMLVNVLRSVRDGARSEDRAAHDTAIKAINNWRVKRATENFSVADFDLDALDIKDDEFFTVPDVFDSGNEEERLTALDEINGTPRNQSLLQHIATSDPSEYVRASAVRKISDQEFLMRIAMDDDRSNVQNAAINAITDSAALIEIAKHSPRYMLNRSALRKLQRQEDLIDVAKNASRIENRVAALRIITDEAFLNETLINDVNDSIRTAAAWRLSELSQIEPLVDPEPLLKALKSDPSGAVREAAMEGVADEGALIDRLLHDPYQPVREYAVRLVENNDALAAAAKNDEDQAVRVLAARRINDEALLKEVYEAVDDDDVKIAALSAITDDEWLRDKILEMDPKDSSSIFVGPYVALRINDQQILASIAEQSPIKPIVNKIIPKLKYNPDLSEKLLREILRETTDDTVIEQAIMHPSPAVRAAAIISPVSSFQIRELVAKTDPDPRIRKLAEALNSGYVSKYGKFVFTPEQMVAGVRELLPQPGSAPRSPSVTAQPRVVASLLNMFFMPTTGRTLPDLTVDRTIPIESLAKGLVAERLTDMTRNVPLSGLLSIVRDVESMSPFDQDQEKSRIKLVAGTDMLSDIISGVDDSTLGLGVADSSRSTVFSPSHKPLSEDFVRNGDNRTFLVLDRTKGSLVAVWYPEGMELPVPGAGTTSAARLGTPEAETLTRDYLLSQVVSWWARTSNDSHVGSLALQESVRRVLGGITGAQTAAWNTSDQLRHDVDLFINRHSQALEAIAKAQHENTQRLLAALGISEIPLYRGAIQEETSVTGTSMLLRRSGDGSLQPAEETIFGEQAELFLRPLSAWASDASVATEFTRIHTPLQGEEPYLFGVKLPATYVFSTPLTGCGCFDETEFVVIGNNEPVIVFGKQEGRSLPNGMELKNVIEAMVRENPSGVVLNPDNSDRNADWVLSVLDTHETSEQLVEQLKQELLGSPNGQEVAVLPSSSATDTPVERMLQYLDAERKSGRTGAVDRVAAMPATMRDLFLRALQDQRFPSSTSIGSRVGAALRSALSTASPTERAAYDEMLRTINARRAAFNSDDLDALDIDLDDDIDALDIRLDDDGDVIDLDSAPEEAVFGSEVMKFPQSILDGRNVREANRSESKRERIAEVQKTKDQHMLEWVAVGDINPTVRREALARLTDQAALERIARSSDGLVNVIAVGRITDQRRLGRLIRSYGTIVQLPVREQAASQLHDQQVIEELLQSPATPVIPGLLARVSRPDVLERYIDNNTNPPRLRWAAISALVAKSGPDAVKRFALESPFSDIRERALEYINDQDFLVKVARQERNFSIRNSVIDRLTDQTVLAEFAENHQDWRTRRTAVRNVLDRDVLLRVAENDPDYRVQLVAVQNLANPGGYGFASGKPTGPLTLEQQQLVSRIAKRASDSGVWGPALTMIQDDDILGEIVLDESAPRRLRLLVLSGINDRARLDVILARVGDEDVRKAALRRLMPPAERGSSWTDIGYEPVQVDAQMEKAAETMLSDLYERYIADFPDGETERDFREGVVEMLRARLQGTPMIAFEESVLGSILLQGALKTQFETGKSNGLFDVNFRSAVEQQWFGVPEWIDPALRPVYGSIEEDEDNPLTRDAYGKMYFFLNTSVLDRATVTGVDSLGAGVVGLPFNRINTASDAELIAASGSDGLSAAYDMFLGSDWGYEAPYAEIQVHGGLPVRDVTELWFSFFDVTGGSNSEDYNDEIREGRTEEVLIELLEQLGFEASDRAGLEESIPGFEEMLAKAVAAIQSGEQHIVAGLEGLLRDIIERLGYNMQVTIGV